jgi:AcrR family transcriptional regulator
VGRPREHDLDTLLDHAKELWADHGTTSLTIRALSTRSGVSNGAIYNAFGSRNNLLARVWSREAEKFLDFQQSVVTSRLQAGTTHDAVVAAALAPADYARRDEQGSRLLLAVTLEDLTDTNLAAAERDKLHELRRALADLITTLSHEVWNRTDRPATTLIKYCLVDLPSALLLARNQPADATARHALELAVRGILASEPPAGSRSTKGGP